MIRFQSVFRRLASGEADWISVALDCGYYDQSHLYRDFRDLEINYSARSVDHAAHEVSHWIATCRK